MKTRSFIISLVLMVVIAVSGVAGAADMTDYCIVPPYVMRDIKPNVMIILDNAEINGEAAYSGLSPDTMPTTNPLGVANTVAYDPNMQYEGLYGATLWYYYDGNDFVPWDPGVNPNGSKAVFEGNLLNWATTSRYDLIQKILVGGKSASRQTTVKTLIGINSGEWEDRIYHYKGEDGKYYTCIFKVNVANRGDLTISESAAYLKNPIIGGTCGLISSPPVRPGVGYRFNSVSLAPSDAGYASSGSFFSGYILRLVNAVLNLGASEAEAAPLKIFSPKTDWTTLPDSELGVSYSYTPVGTGGTGNYVWSAVPDARPWKGLPAGLTVDPVTGAISGIPIGPANDATNPYYAFALKLHDTGLAAPDTPVYRFLNIKVTGVPLVIQAPATQLTDAKRYTNYNNNKGFRCIATGGVPFVSTDVAITGVPAGETYYIWTATGLPNSLSINNTTGFITGYVNDQVKHDLTSSYYAVTLTAQDSMGRVATSDVKMLLWEPITITYPAPGAPLKPVNRYEKYGSIQPYATGGRAPYTWDLTVSDSRLNIGINATTGVISGISNVTAPQGVYSVTLKVTDTDGNWISKSYSLEVVGTPLAITTPSYDYKYLQDAYRYEDYPGYVLRGEGGTGSYTWTVTGLPTGMIYNSTTGLIYGTPTEFTTSSDYQYHLLTIKLSDGVDTVTRYTYLRVIKSGLNIKTPDSYGYITLINGASYTSAFQAYAVGGNPAAYTWSATGLPTGLSIDAATGRISGTPMVGPFFSHGSYRFYSAKVSISDGTSSDYVYAYFYIVAPEYTGALDLTYWSPGYGYKNQPWSGYIYDYVWSFRYDNYVYNSTTFTYDKPYTWYVGTGPLTWSITTGSLPPGTSLDPYTGAVYGIPTVDGNFPVTVSVTDGVTVDTYAQTLYVYSTSSYPYIWYPGWGSWLPTGRVDSPYAGYKAQMYIGSGATGIIDTADYYWETPPPGNVNSLPEGLVINPSTGLISGTPTKAYPTGKYVRINLYRHADGGLQSYTYAYIPVDENVVEIISPAHGSSFPDAYAGFEYLSTPVTAVAVGASGSYKWGISNAPAWLAIDLNTGKISGSPPATATLGTFNVVINIKDAITGQEDSAIFTIVVKSARGSIQIVSPPKFTAVGAPGYYQITEGDYFSAQIAVSGGTPPYKFGFLGIAPGLNVTRDGLASGHMFGYPLTTFGSRYYIYVCVQDAKGNTVGGTPTAEGKCTLPVAALTHYFVLDITPVPLLSQSFNIRVCAGDYTDNCTLGSFTKHGLLHDKWSEARWGFGDFANDGSPNVTCLPETNEPSFFTAVENAVPVGVFTELVNAIYESMQMYRGDSAPSCDPFAGDESPCRRNFILMLTDGSGADNPPVPSGTAPSVFGAADTPPMPDVCAALPYTLAKNACYGYVNDLRPDLEGNQSVSTYIVSAMGTNDAILQSAADASDGLFYKANDPSELARQIAQALEDIIKRAASGTAASVLASGQGTGANLIQALYFPRREFVDVSTGTKDQISWVGMISDFWYYVDPRFRYNSIREETVQSNPPVLNLVEDYAINMFFNTTSEVVEAARYRDTDADGNADVYVDTVDFNEVNSIWEVGQSLWERDLTTNPRTIYTSVDGQNLIAFTNTTARANATLRQYMDATDVDHADDIARWIHGEDIGGYRSRTVSADASGVKRVWKLGDILNSTPKIVSSDMNNPSYERCFGPADLYTKHSYGSFLLSDVYRRRGVVYAGGNDGMLHAFYLGVMNVGEWAGHNAADRARLENDLEGLGVELGDELWSYIPKNALPYLKYQMEGDYCHLYTVDMTPYVVDAMVVADTASPELADLPDLLPIAAAGQQSSTCTPGTYEECRATIHSWRTILIGGMRYGGACEPVTTGNCPVDLNGDGDLTNDCVKAPIADVGFSSYFALDITDTTAPPKLLWEFTHPDLGFSTTGPAIVRLQPKTSGGQISDAKTGMFNLNGKWYVVFGSGPTGPIKKSTKQFMAQSDQNLRFFVFDVYLGPGAGNADVTVIDSGIPKAFAGSMIDTTVDRNLGGGLCTGPLKDPADFVDDALYVGYVTPETNDSLDANLDGAPAVMWNNGGIGRLTFHTDLNPANWEFATLMENVGPVTSAPTHMARKNTAKVPELWVFGASGRYYFLDTDDPDDSQTPGNVVGFVDPCYNGAAGGLSPYDAGCTTKVSMAGLADVTTDLNAGKGGIGWRLTLDAPYTYTNPVTGKALSFYAERVITDLVASTREGRVYVTAMKPYSDICSIGGVSSIWVFDASSGGAPGQMKGTAIVQVSTGSIEQIDLADAFDPTDAATRGGRRTSFMIEGLPPMMQGMSMFSPPPPAPRIMHLIQKTQERLP